ncbi:hypothetical protein BJ138DRAFT_1105233 [Hygrophoropsis aurantiaca]|uniref:Uncharacterized protein n=1 Tax=Hygrophoropsis aurantiaca TaxID=72124 RepID=A0ACB8A144_9AGAM|nr:hypothetical protein BJ138DRAFT_1105233 [Hygrophoropsis aurantiaca]
MTAKHNLATEDAAVVKRAKNTTAKVKPSNNVSNGTSDSSTADEENKVAEIAQSGIKESMDIEGRRTDGTMLPDITDYDQIAKYDNLTQGRIQMISTYTNNKAGIYSLPNILPTATWGSYHPIENKNKVICDPATGQPITFWIIGHLTRVQFTYDNAPAKQASLSIALLSEALSRQTSNILAKLSKPTQSTIGKGWAELRAIKWQSTRAGDGGNSEPTLFDAVYDARKKLLPKSKMDFYSPLDLKKKDLVLVEARLTRYNIREDGKWLSRSQFEFTAINILHDAVDTGSEIIEDKSVEIEDLNF